MRYQFYHHLCQLRPPYIRHPRHYHLQLQRIENRYHLLLILELVVGHQQALYDRLHYPCNLRIHDRIIGLGHQKEVQY